VCDSFEEPLYSIGKTAKLLNISVHTLRMYEREGLIVPFKKSTSHRLYSRSDIEKINCIRSAINDKKLSIAGIKLVYSLIPCWDIVKCSPADRSNCNAYNKSSEPCWTFKHKDNICADSICRDCLVYREYTDCHKVKESIRNLSREQ
jgi:MerR family transcriptional regulator/heat shock protein HspR